MTSSANNRSGRTRWPARGPSRYSMVALTGTMDGGGRNPASYGTTARRKARTPSTFVSARVERPSHEATTLTKPVVVLAVSNPADEMVATFVSSADQTGAAHSFAPPVSRTTSAVRRAVDPGSSERGRPAILSAEMPERGRSGATGGPGGAVGEAPRHAAARHAKRTDAKALRIDRGSVAGASGAPLKRTDPSTRQCPRRRRRTSAGRRCAVRRRWLQE